MEYKKGLLFMLILASIAINIFFIATENPDSTYCLSGQGCKIVQNSVYATLLGDTRNSHLGMIAFLALFLVFFLTYKNKIKYKYFLAMTYVGAILAVYFIYLQFFVINAICSNCMAIDIIMIIIAVVAILDYREKRL